MNIVISGVAYGLEDSISKATLGDLYLLKVKLGVSVKTIQNTFKKFGDIEDAVDLLDDADALLNLQGIIWLSRRKAGEDTSFEAAAAVSFVDLAFEDDDDAAADEAEGGVEPDPKA